jgi:hypothetical protein
MCSVDLNMDTISGTTYIEVVFSLPGADKHFIGNALCSFDNSVTQL